MTERERLRTQYMEGWYQMDADMLVSAVVPGFEFHDPAEPEIVTRNTLPAYMVRWDDRTRLMGSNNEWLLTDTVRQDSDGVLIDWEYWKLLGTDLEGMALVKTTDEGVCIEKICYMPPR